VLFSGLPALAMARATPLEALMHMGRGGQGRSFVPRRSLVIVQVTLSFVMITSAGLLASSLGQLERQPLGFEPANRSVVRLDMPASDATEARLALFYPRLQERIRRVPGVVNVSYALYSPMEGNNWSSAIGIAGRTADPARPDFSSWNRVGPEYFATVGTRVLRGRAIDERDAPGMRRVVVVSDAFAKRFFGETDPIGQRLGLGSADHAGDFEIVGVVEDVKYANASQPVRPMMFFPAFQSVAYEDATARSVQLRSMLLRAIVIQTVPGAGNLEPALRAAVAEIDANVNVTRVISMPDQVSGNFRIERLMSRVTSLYGALALVLASLGLYGVTAYSVAQRTREIGVRLALGADRWSIIRHVVGAPVLATGIGLLLGVPLAAMAANAIKTQLYGIDSQHITVLAVASVVLVTTAALAAALPALRAASIDPSRALRTTQ
jgi:predicted permease